MVNVSKTKMDRIVHVHQDGVRWHHKTFNLDLKPFFLSVGDVMLTFLQFFFVFCLIFVV